jgi:AmmeMemoRadiSam system protein B
MSKIRKTAVSGAFYPDEVNELSSMVEGFLQEADIPEKAPVPKVIIVPHAGYIYSGAVAAKAFALLAKGSEKIKRIVLIGASHKVLYTGMAFSTADYFESPLGNFELDKQMAENVSFNRKHTGFLDAAHKDEHSLEVMLPFIAATVGGECKILPVLTGEVSQDNVINVLQDVWGGDETVIVISSDLSHYLDYSTCQKIDEQTKNAIENFDDSAIDGSKACGYIPICAFLKMAKEKQMKVKTLDVRNSGDAVGPKDRVVGYGAWAFWE